MNPGSRGVGRNLGIEARKLRSRKHRQGVARTKFPDSGGAPESPAGAVSGSLGVNNNKEDLKRITTAIRLLAEGGIPSAAFAG